MLSQSILARYRKRPLNQALILFVLFDSFLVWLFCFCMRACFFVVVAKFNVVNNCQVMAGNATGRFTIPYHICLIM